MAWFYVKDGGAAAGDAGRHATQQTGSFAALGAANYYNTIEDANGATTPPADGDFILVSDTHDKAYSPSSTLGLGSSSSGSGISYFSVDDTAIDAYKPGAREDHSATGLDVNFGGVAHVAGISFKPGDDFTANNGRTTLLQDLTLELQGANDDILLGSDGGVHEWRNVIYKPASTSSEFQISNGGFLRWIGGSVDVSSAVPSKLLGIGSGANGGMSLQAIGVDFGGLSGNLVTFGNETTVDVCHLVFRKCQLHPSVTIQGGTFHLPTQRIELYECDDSTSDNIYGFYIEDGSGTAKENSSIYVTGEEVMYGTSDKISIEVTTSSRCNSLKPFRFEIPAQYIDLASAGSDVLKAHFTSGTALDDADLSMYCIYPDGTTAVQANIVSSGAASVWAHDPLSTGSALDTTSGKWTSGLANTYSMDLDTSGDAGQAAVPIVIIEVYKPSVTIHFGTEFELS